MNNKNVLQFIKKYMLEDNVEMSDFLGTKAEIGNAMYDVNEVKREVMRHMRVNENMTRYILLNLEEFYSPAEVIKIQNNLLKWRDKYKAGYFKRKGRPFELKGDEGVSSHYKKMQREKLDK